MCSHSNVNLYLPAKFRSNQTKGAGSSYDIISMFQDGGLRVGNLLPSSDLVTALIQGGENLFAYQISIRYLNPRLR